MAKCWIENKPVVPVLPDKVVLEMTGDEAMKLYALLQSVYQEHPTTSFSDQLYGVLAPYGIRYRAVFQHTYGSGAHFKLEKMNG